jgi:hypothetical protein
MAMNPDGQLAVVGEFSGTPVNFGRHRLDLVPFSANTFTVVYSPDGRDRWASHIWGVSIPNPYSVAIKPNGNVYVTGFTVLGGGLHLGDVRYQLPSQSGMYLVKMSSTDGVIGWGRVIDTPEEFGVVSPATVMYTTSGMVAVAGLFRGQTDFGTGPIGSSALERVDAFVVRIYP